MTQSDVEKLRLALSTFQDGFGMLPRKANRVGTLPGWRDFERSVALVLGGEAQESKAIFDVLVPIPQTMHCYGVACKMRKLLRHVEKTGRVTIEVSNSASRFEAALRAAGIRHYTENPSKSGQVIVDLVKSWHDEVGIPKGQVDLTRSFYLVLQWDERTLDYQLYQYPLALPDPGGLAWQGLTNRLVGVDQDGENTIEYYSGSGGQLKYYALAAQALWKSDVFTLEALPASEAGYGLAQKVAQYYPDAWASACVTAQE